MFLTFLTIYFHVGQLAKLGYCIIFDYFGFIVQDLRTVGYCIIFDYSGFIVQDPRTGQELKTGPKLGVCFSWTTFVFHLLLLFLLLQLLQFLQFLPLHFGILDLITHLPLGYNNWLLDVC